MANQVFANTMEVSCKAASGKSVCAFPDVCFTPPQTPATPPGVPIPYPNTGMASDCTSGSKSVKISKQEVMLKNKSYFKRSTGDEAGCAPKKGVVTSKNMGKVYFIAWSMDVKVEGENVVRTLDMTTHNHASQGPNTPPMAYFDEVAVVLPEKCRDQAEKANRACRGATKRPKRQTSKGSVDDGMDCTEDCRKEQKCILIPKSQDKQACCHPDTTGHHMIEDHWIKDNPNFSWYRSNRTTPPQSLKLTDAERASGMATIDDAPCVCVNESRFKDEHQEMHNVQGVMEETFVAGGDNHVPAHPSHGWTFGEAKRATINAHEATFSAENPDNECDRDCLEAQIDAFYDTPDDTPLNEPHMQPFKKDGSRETTNRNWKHVGRR